MSSRANSTTCSTRRDRCHSGLTPTVEHLLSIPSEISKASLKLNPTWRDLWNNPCFKEMVRESQDMTVPPTESGEGDPGQVTERWSITSRFCREMSDGAERIHTSSRAHDQVLD